jgi:hypothetical protein
MITLNTVTARQCDRKKQKPIRRSGKNNAQLCTSECEDAYLNLGSHSELGEMFWIRAHWFVSTMLFRSPVRQKGSKLPNHASCPNATHPNPSMDQPVRPGVCQVTPAGAALASVAKRLLFRPSSNRSNERSKIWYHGCQACDPQASSGVFGLDDLTN